MKQKIFIFLISKPLYYFYLLKNLIFKTKKDRLHIGCGNNIIHDWINADITPSSEIIVFLQKKLPFRKNSLTRVYTEHVLEHVSYETGLYFLKEVNRVLEKGGVIRIAMPDLDYLVDAYVNNWKRLEWVNWAECSFVKTRGQMMNISFYWWGHKYIYNREDVSRLLHESGFHDFHFAKWGESKYNDLSNLETRKDSKLIVEAIKK